MRKLLILAASCALLAAGWIPAAGAASKSTRHVIPGSRPGWAVGRNRSGGVDPSSGVVIRVYLRGADDAGLEAVARAVSDPHSPAYHHFLTPAEVRVRYAPTDASVRAVESWLRANGLQVSAVPANNMYVEASGPAGRIAVAFGVHLNTYRVRGM